MVLLLLLSTLADRPVDSEALRHFPAEVLERGRQFSREVRMIASAKHLLGMATLAWLCFSRPGAAFLAGLERLGRGRLWLGLAAVSTGLSLVMAAVELPFALYLGWWHERTYGLSSEPLGGWLADFAMGLGLDLALSLLFWLPLYWLIKHLPRTWWAPGGLVYTGFTGLMILLSPVLLMPLFNDITPVEDPQIVGMVQRLADRAGAQITAVNQIEVSGETSRVNAMVTGLGPTKQVIVYDTLLKQFRADEVEVVLAHELAHAIYRDVVAGWLLSATGTLLAMYLSAGMLRGMVGLGPLGLPVPHAARGLALLTLLMTLLGQVMSPVQNIASRRMEVRADRFALELTRNPEAFVSGFKKLAAGNPGDVDPPAVVEFLAHSHPSVMHRIRAALQMQRASAR